MAAGRHLRSVGRDPLRRTHSIPRPDFSRRFRTQQPLALRPRGLATARTQWTNLRHLAEARGNKADTKEHLGIDA